MFIILSERVNDGGAQIWCELPQVTIMSGKVWMGGVDLCPQIWCELPQVTIMSGGREMFIILSERVNDGGAQIWCELPQVTTMSGKVWREGNVYHFV